jgi:hypothetical protein
MTDRQFLWGLSNGIIVLALAGTFWFGYGFGPHLGEAGWVVAGVFTIALYGTCATIIWLAVRLKRTVGFKRSELKQNDEPQRAETRRLMIGFLIIGIVQTVLIALAVPLCFLLGYEDLVGPSIALIVSLHFIPLGRIFHVQAYYSVGIVGGGIALVAFAPVFDGERLMYLGGAMGVVSWLSAFYIVKHAGRIAAKAINEPWSV